ncbi:MAG: hypothetical protein F6K22_23000 [Okeania sp. SIO2F4]|uniref:hypothetical protein n=1 Tax=Okeania sp. SIO2F4 TaxID=2607790 RepID=UPI0014292C9C|nr:hypothetical protein [Okeania sp. SIO2F4]NES05428.1 hypothetical protein [Okeania sp. SIO2F4]
MKISKARSIKIPFFPDPNPEEKLRRYSNNSGQIEFFFHPFHQRGRQSKSPKNSRQILRPYSNNSGQIEYFIHPFHQRGRQSKSPK